jgi:hypothetical protein
MNQADAGRCRVGGAEGKATGDWADIKAWR